jgi:hypothetical protein
MGIFRSYAVLHLTRIRSKIAPLKTHFLDLIRLEFTVEEEKIGATMPTLTPPPNPDKPKLLDQVRDVTRRKHYSTARALTIANHVTQAFARALPWMRVPTSFTIPRPTEGLSLLRTDLTFVTFSTL